MRWRRRSGSSRTRAHRAHLRRACRKQSWRPSASWLSGGCSSRRIMPQATWTFGPPRPNSRLGRAGRPYRACCRHIGATGCEPVGIVAGATTAVEDCGTRTSKGAISCGLTNRRLRLANVPRYEFLIVVQRRKHGLRRHLGCRSFLRVDASTNAMGSANGPRGRQSCRRGDEEGGRRGHEEGGRRGHGEPHPDEAKRERTPHG